MKFLLQSGMKKLRSLSAEINTIEDIIDNT